jgi:anti-anti-sigma regulatory factor
MMPANYLQAGVGLTPGGVILDLRGEFNGFAKEALNAACAEAEAKYPETILLNFKEINYINSTAITVILTLLAKARLEAPPPSPRPERPLR